MPIFLNGQPVSPVVSFLTTFIVTAGLIALGIFLLPVIGIFFLILLAALAGIVIYGVYYRWRYGDPFKRMQEQMQRNMAGMQQRGFDEQPADEYAASEPEDNLPKNHVRAGVRRTVTVEDAVVVSEVNRRCKNQDE